MKFGGFILFLVCALKAESFQLETRQVKEVKNETSHAVNSCKVPRALRESCTQHPNVTEHYCLSLGCCWDELENGADCFRRSVATSGFKSDEYVGENPFCSASDGTYLLGDVDGNEMFDQVCMKDSAISINITTGDEKTIDTKVVSVSGCAMAGDARLMGDVNGDGKSDVVCVKQNGGVMVWISKDGNPDFYDTEPWEDEKFGFCVSHTKMVRIKDFNGDGIADLLCTPETSGAKRSLALGEGSGTFLAPIDDPNFPDFCKNSGDKLLDGDFDADGRDDLICRVDEGKKYQIALTDGDGLLVNEDFVTVGSWCNKTTDTFLVGDFNGDHHDDWMCHHADGSVCVKYNSHVFKAASMFEIESCEAIDWCPQGDVTVAEYNGDGMDDLYCLDGDGKTSVTIAVVQAFMVDFLQVDWDSDVAWNGTKFCKDKELYVGDVNGDNRQDVVCHENKGGQMQRILGNYYGQLIYSDKWTSFKDPDDVGRFCHKTHQYPEYPKLHKGDVNGDGQDDVICHQFLTGDVTVAYSNDQGMFHDSDSRVLKSGFCQGVGSRVHLLDFDHTGKVDMVCRTSTSIKFWIQNDRGTSDEWTHPEAWCQDDNDEVLVGNDLETEILLCHNRETGKTSTLAAVTVAQKVIFRNVDGMEDWCLSRDKKQLKVGDFNGDKLADVLCHEEDGKIKIGITNGGNSDSVYYASVGKFCSEPGSALSVFDANGDGYDDLTCHESTGRITISESHLLEQVPEPKTQQQVPEPKTQQQVPEPQTQLGCSGVEWNAPAGWTGTVPAAYFSLDNLGCLDRRIYASLSLPHNGEDMTVVDGKVNKAVKLIYYSDVKLGVVTSACITRPETCENGGGVTFWLDATDSEPEPGGIITSTIESQGRTVYSGFRITTYNDTKQIISVMTHDRTNELATKYVIPEGWFHVALVFTGNKLHLYLNGENVSTHEADQYSKVPASFKVSEGNGEVVIGRSFSDTGGQYQVFSIDELAFWNQALTAAEIRTLYEAV